MKLCKRMMLSILVVPACSLPALAQDINAAEHLNAGLGQKPNIMYDVVREVRESNCRDLSQLSPQDLAQWMQGGEGGGREGGEHGCGFRMRKVHSAESSKAKVVSTQVAEIKELKFDLPKRRDLPSKALVAYQTFRNCANVQMTNTVSLSVTGTKGYQLTKGRTVGTTVGASGTLNATIPSIGSASSTASVSRTVTVQRSETESSSESITRALNTTISVQPKTAGRLSLLAYESVVELPFSALVVVDGALAQNASGYNKASELLSVEERTLPFSGVLKLQDVSESLVETHPLVEVACATSDVGSLVTSESTFEAPAAALSDKGASFVPIQRAFGSPKGKVVAPFDLGKLATRMTEGPVIGPLPDGVSYEIVFTTDAARPEPRCGFNDIGVANTALFTVEQRQYTLRVGGLVASRWMETVESFKQCYSF